MHLRPMKRWPAVLGLALAMASCSAPEDAPGAPVDDATGAAPAATPVQMLSSTADPAILTLEGLGALRIGMAIPQDSGWREDETQISDECRTYASNNVRSAYAMGDGKVVKRITVSEGSGVKTEKGVGIGASEAEVRGAYPGIKAEPHEYIAPPAKYLTWLPKAGGPGLRFEIGADGKVMLIHAGVMPWLTYSEGCA